jgi:hypothetical protein
MENYRLIANGNRRVMWGTKENLSGKDYRIAKTKSLFQNAQWLHRLGHQ